MLVSANMSTGQHKAFCVLRFSKCESIITVQRDFRRHYGIDAPTAQSIRRWYKQFEETGCLCKGKSTGRPRVSDDNVERIRESFQRSPCKSTNRASRELEIPQTTVWRVLRRRLTMKPYRLQLLQALKPNDKLKRLEFSIFMQEAMQDENFASRLVFSDEASFHLSGKVNRHNVRIWGTTNPHAIIEHERDSPKLNVFCAISKTLVYGPFFFTENTVNGRSYLEMLQTWLFPQLNNNSDDYIYQQDGAPPHWHLDVRGFLNETLPNRWIGRNGTNDLTLCSWPPRSPDLTPCDYFFWGCVKDAVYIPPLPSTLDELKNRIKTAVESITKDMLQEVWNEFDYRLDVIRVTKGAHIEHL